MQLGDGYGDWNVPWASWQTGGLVQHQLTPARSGLRRSGSRPPAPLTG